LDAVFISTVGTGYEIELGGVTLPFPTAGRAPSEAYFGVDYVA
jgi:hypothetical protein